MPRERVTLECSEAKAAGKPASRYRGTRNKKLKTDKLEMMKYNPFMKKRTLHKEIKD